LSAYFIGYLKGTVPRILKKCNPTAETYRNIGGFTPFVIKKL